MLNIEIKINPRGLSFHDHDKLGTLREVKRLIEQAARGVGGGRVSDDLHDGNGKKVGAWKITDTLKRDKKSD